MPTSAITQQPVKSGEFVSPSHLSALLWGLLGVVIWSGSFVLTRFGVKSSLTAYDIIALRFGTGGLLLVPVLFKNGLGINRLGFKGVILLVAGAGAPYALLTATGLRFAPAAQAAALIPGIMTVLVAIFSTILWREKLPRRSWVGIGLILTGALFVASQSLQANQYWGHLAFFTAAILWAAYVIALRGSGINALHATAIAAVISAIFYLPIYFIALDSNISTAPWNDIVTQAIYQGAFTTVIGLVAFNRAVAGLGATAGAALSSLIPVITLILGVFFLGEIPGPSEIIAIVLIIAGVLCLTIIRKQTASVTTNNNLR